MPDRVPTGRAHVRAGLCGLLGTGMLIASFALNTGPPAGDTAAQLTAFEQQHLDAILWGAWLQAVGPVFIVVFVFTIIRAAGATARVAGWMTVFGAGTLMTVSLAEIVFYIGALHASPAAMADISFAFLRADQHLYFIVAAPALFTPLGLVILGSDVLPPALGYLALALAAGYALAGVATMTDLTVPVAVQISASVQVLWWLAAGITFIVRARPASPAAVPVRQAAGHPIT